MEEVVISSGDELEMKERSEREEEKQRKQRKEETGEVKKKKKNKKEGEGLNGVVRWEGFLPRMVLRVLLVEADDSTRQIIAALLKKCSYRVVSVPDGLKAWETLKGRPRGIDLILTEVDLPSISGYPLLTLIMEHEICKNIPVIMMSTQDSISTVYKCMLRGAADYLVKPLRKNELRNLWQHVWRRQSMSPNQFPYSQSLAGGNGPQEESVGQDKIEATSENSPASNHASGEMAPLLRSKGQTEKGSDAQSSCTKPDLEAESTHMENIPEFLQPVWSKFSLTDMNMQKREMHVNLGQKLLLHDREAEGSAAAAHEDANKMDVDKEISPGNGRTDATESCDNDVALSNSHIEAFDFMGASTNRSSSFNNVKINLGSSPHLDLSLRRSHPSGFEIQDTEERHSLKHSNASAFTRYINRPLQLPHSALESTRNQKELGTNYDRKLSINFNVCNSDTLSLAPSTQKSDNSLDAGQTKESEIATSSPGQKLFPIQIPAKETRFNNVCNSYGSVFPPIFFKQSGLSPMMSPGSACQQEPAYKVNHFQHLNHGSTSEQLYDRLGQHANDSTNDSLQKQENRLDSLEDRGLISPATDQSASSSLCNGAASHFNSLGFGSTSGSNSNVDQVAIVRAASENEEGVFTHSYSHRSIQREAALTKFRLKRKERCYEKKVRYESRKKLAEQRPRVKGQFVRQVHIDPSPTETDQ
ncbi:hypothetical protein SADUNF_Sadunf12G0002300 [Salix dunnii]|uniref:Two-component response regulator-like APRR5 n=1 Tax=Salix dunnii TaxID=1413687 RepID=A0A835JHR8_9ROSI|nr:hypothetical protein SADUNF_Sadunf12G0002300 [Salix dunnii]